MMNEKTSPERTERLLALCALAASQAPAVDECPSAERMAAFIEGSLKGTARAAMLAHLNRCPTCYHQWLDAAAYLNAAQPVSRPSEAWSLAGIRARLDALWAPWALVPATAMVVLAALIAWWPASPDLNRQLTEAYAALDTGARESFTPHLQSLPLPWEQAALGFSGAAPTAPAQAFGAGLWAGRGALLGLGEGRMPERLVPATGVAWPETGWADYYAFGRWSVLTWAVAQSPPTGEDWTAHARILDALLENFARHAPGEPKAAEAIEAGKRVKTRLEAVRASGDPGALAALGRELLLTMQRLAPGQL